MKGTNVNGVANCGVASSSSSMQTLSGDMEDDGDDAVGLDQLLVLNEHVVCLERTIGT